MFESALRQPLLVWALDPLEDALAGAYLEMGRADEAIAEYERILAINARYPLARYHLAQAYERRNDSERAAVEYRRFLESWSTADTGIPEVDAARERLAILSPG